MVMLLAALVLNIDSLLADTPGNAGVWTGYMENCTGDTLECCLYLLKNIPRLDRLEMTTEALDDHILHSLPFRSGLPDSVFLPGLLLYRTAEEPVSSFRGTLGGFWDSLGASEPREVAEWAEENLQVLSRRYLGGMQDPMQVLESRAGTPGEIQVFLAASLRAMGFPVRTVTGWFAGESGGEESWLEVWENGRWSPMREDFTGLMLAAGGNGGLLTGNCTETFTLIVEPPGSSFGEYLVSLNLPVDGRYLPLDMALCPDTVQLGSGNVLICLSRRLPSGAVEVWNSFISPLPGDTVHWDASDLVANRR
ncbi:MAG TPA: transglutaminase-like domain-containing protein [Candidatus Sabulitectum sp.]|nr:transglutaminase-like domain-containing protein [Candidatus Sabulitectum sp.]HPJ28360.1 transglutaminase-like domain-containing protein [Candidatus Sabulitectum sp.]HPR21493.1 transglutaminase-like domain-containing protein [Candidatus Sabulitectum sp.]